MWCPHQGAYVTFVLVVSKKKNHTHNKTTTFVECQHVAYRSNMYPNTADGFWVLIWKPKVLPLLCLVSLTQGDRMWGHEVTMTWCCCVSGHELHSDMFCTHSPESEGNCSHSQPVWAVEALCRPLLSETIHTTVWCIHSPLPPLCGEAFTGRGPAWVICNKAATKLLLPELQQQMRRAVGQEQKPSELDLCPDTRRLWHLSTAVLRPGVSPLRRDGGDSSGLCLRGHPVWRHRSWSGKVYWDVGAASLGYVPWKWSLRAATYLCVGEREDRHRSFRSDSARVMRSVCPVLSVDTHIQHVNDMRCEHSSN